MIINIIHDKNQEINSLFWYNFFRTIGVWTNTYTLTAFQNKINHQEKYIYIISEKELDYYKKENNFIYLLNQSSNSYKQENLFHIRANNEKDYLEILNFICSRFQIAELEQKELIDLLNTFIKYKIWYILWIYQEVGIHDYKNYKPLSDNMLELIDKTKEELNEKLSHQDNLLYTKFMYYQLDSLSYYYKEGINNNMDSESEFHEKLMNFQNDFWEDFKNSECSSFHPRCYELIGDSLSWSMTLNKFSPFKYINASKYVTSSNIKYKIASKRIYFYGYDEIAIAYLKKSYLIDKENFRAIYQLKKNMYINSPNEWIDAFHWCDIINNILKKYISEPEEFTSIIYIEYYLKNLKLMREIITKENISFDEEIINIDTSIEKTYNKIINENLYEHILNSMAINGKRNMEEEEYIKELTREKVKNFLKII